MRRAVAALLLATTCLALLSACRNGGSPNPTGGANPQKAYIEQLSLERQGLGTGSMYVEMPTSGTQGAGGTMSVTISGSASGRPTITITASGSASASRTVVATPVAVGGEMDVHATCAGLTCSAVDDVPQPVDTGLTGTWTWNLTYGAAGTGTVQLVADLYETSSTNVLWQSAPLTETVSIQATQQQKVDRSLAWLRDVIISVSAVGAALAPLATWLYKWRAKKRRRPAPGDPAEASGGEAPSSESESD